MKGLIENDNFGIGFYLFLIRNQVFYTILF